MYQRILLVGSRGMLAHAIRRSLARRALRCEGVDRDECDITDPAAVQALVDSFKPTLLVNCAGYTAVDRAEQEEELATQINGVGPGHLASACSEAGTMFVHFSTDFVFDGSSSRPYREDDKPNPLGAYARSKLAGEAAIARSALADWLTIRTAWLYGPPGEAGARPFPKVVIDNARAGKPLRIVNDQHGSPTFTFDVADAMLALVDARARGVFHVTNAGQTTWFGFAKAVCESFRVTPVELSPITSSEWSRIKPDSARRPANSVLDLTKLQQTIGRDMRPWDTALRDYCAITAGAP